LITSSVRLKMKRFLTVCGMTALWRLLLRGRGGLVVLPPNYLSPEAFPHQRHCHSEVPPNFTIGHNEKMTMKSLQLISCLIRRISLVVLTQRVNMRKAFPNSRLRPLYSEKPCPLGQAGTRCWLKFLNLPLPSGRLVVTPQTAEIF